MTDFNLAGGFASFVRADPSCRNHFVAIIKICLAGASQFRSTRIGPDPKIIEGAVARSSAKPLMFHAHREALLPGASKSSRSGCSSDEQVCAAGRQPPLVNRRMGVNQSTGLTTGTESGSQETASSPIQSVTLRND
jgi:hypothetical protein